MEHKPLVSVLMTVYNREKYIKQAIESVIASTYQNWELIIVDDRSKDTSVAIANTYAQQDKRISVYVNENNLGDYPNRNQAASYAKGKYLKYVDADDMIYPHGLELLVYYMEQFPDAGYGLCSLPQDKFKKYPFQLSPKEAYQRHYFEQPLFHKAPLSAISIERFLKKRVDSLVNVCWEILRCGILLSQTHPVVLMPHGIVWYREHDEQEMADHRTDPMHPFKYILLAEEFLTVVMCPLSESEKHKALKKVQRLKSKAILSASKHHSLKKSLELKNASGLSFIDILKFKFM